MESEERAMKEAVKERDETGREALSVRFSPELTVSLPRDHPTKVIAYGPPYRAGARYDVVVRWPGHQRLTFRDLGDGSVQVSEFDPVDEGATGNSDRVLVTVSKQGVDEPQLTGSDAFIGGYKHVVSFYDFEIGREDVVTLFMVSYSD